MGDSEAKAGGDTLTRRKLLFWTAAGIAMIGAIAAGGAWWRRSAQSRWTGEPGGELMKEWREPAHIEHLADGAMTLYFAPSRERASWMRVGVNADGLVETIRRTDPPAGKAPAQPGDS